MLSEVRSKMAFFWHLYPIQNADMEASPTVAMSDVFTDPGLL